jgi:hypothetical protein
MRPEADKKPRSLLRRLLSGLAGRYPNTLATLFGGLAVLLALVSVEAGLRLKAALTRSPPAVSVEVLGFGAYTRPDVRLGFSGLPRASCTDFARRGDETLFEKPFTLDAAGWRVVPSAGDAARTHAALFFGCSFTFGTGSDDSETLPARFAAHAPCYASYDFAMPAYGPQQMWLLLHDPGFIAGLPHAPGIAVYVYLGHHRNRLQGADDVIASWPYNLPRLVLRAGRIAVDGWHVVEARRDYRPWEHLHLFRWMQHRFAQAPAMASPMDTDALLTQLLVECADTLAAQRPAMRFIVIPFPMQADPALPAAVKTAPNLTVLNFDDGAFQAFSGDAGFYRDGRAQVHGHPKPVLLDAIAARLAGEAAAMDSRLACKPSDKP